MKKTYEKYKKLSTSKKIGVAVIMNMVLATIIISIAMSFQYSNIKGSQEELPTMFFQSYGQYSLEEISYKAKQLILVVIDYRMALIQSVKNIMVGRPLKRPENQRKKYDQYSRCYHTQKNNTIFSCSMDQYARIMLQSTWPGQNFRISRRFNIIYQNKNNSSDIMITTISEENQDFQIRKIDRIHKQINKTKEGKLQISSFYNDEYGRSEQKLVSFNTKIQFDNYDVILEMETYGGFLTVSVTRVLYLSATNLVVLALNETQQAGYSVVASFQDLHPQINYTRLLEKGHAVTQLSSGQKIYSYTIAISSCYTMNQTTHPHNQNLNNNFVLIVHSPSNSQVMESNVFKFISQLYHGLLQMLFFFSIIIVINIIANSVSLAYQIGRRIKILKLSIIKFMESYGEQNEKQENQYTIANNLLYESHREGWFGSVMRITYQIIKKIQFNKYKFRKKSDKMHIDYFPLNLIQQQFLLKYNLSYVKDMNYYKKLMFERRKTNKKLTMIREDSSQLKISTQKSQDLQNAN